MIDPFDEERKKLGIKVGKSTSTIDPFDTERMDLGLIPDTRKKPEPMKAPTKLVLDDTLKSVTPTPKKEIDFKAEVAKSKVAPKQESKLQGKLPASSLLVSNETKVLQDKLKGKLPASSLVTSTGGGPANASDIPGISQYEINKKYIDENASPIVKPFSNTMNYLTEGNPIGVAVGNAFSGNSGATRKDSSGNKTVDKVADAVNNFVTPFITSTGAPMGQGIIGSSYEAVGNTLKSATGQKIVSTVGKYVPFVNGQAAENIARTAITEGVAGGIQGVGIGLQQGQDSWDDIKYNAKMGAAGGFILGGAGAAAGEGFSKLASLFRKSGLSEAEIAEIAPDLLSLPEANPRTMRKQLAGEIKTTSNTDPISNPYTFKLDEASPNTRRAADNAAEGRAEVRDIDNQINDLTSSYEQAVIDEYKVLKEQRDNPKGKTKGSMNFDDSGDMVSKNGWISNNPPWYQKAMLENNYQRLSNKKLYELARKHVDEGFETEVGRAPSWKQENGFDEQLAALTSVRESMKQSVREIDPPLNVTDSQLAVKKLKDTRINGETPYKEPVIRNPKELTREQEVNNRVLSGGELTQEDIDFLLSPEYNPNNLYPESTPTESTYVKPKTEVKTQVKSSVKEEVAATVEADLKPTVKRTIVTEVKKPSKLSTNPEKNTAGIRANFKTMSDSGNISAKLKGKIGELDQRYEVSKNADVIANSNKAIKDLSATENKFLLNESGGAQHISDGYRVMQELDKAGEHARALAIADKLAKDLTKAGQTTQAASLIQRLSPEGQLLNLIRTAEKNGKVVELADKVKFTELAAKVQENTGAGKAENAITDILKRLEEGGESPDDIKALGDYLKNAESKIKPKAVKDRLPEELNDVRKRDKVVSFLEAQEEAARQRIAKRKGRLNSLPVDEWIDYSVLIAAKVAKGVIKAETHVEDLVKLFGEEIKPIATQVFEKAQQMVGRVSKSAARGDLERAKKAFEKISGQANAKEKALVKETADHVRQLIEDAKSGKLTAESVQKLRDYSDEIAEIIAEKPPTATLTQDQKFLQTVKSLSKKIAQVESEKVPMDQANKEVSNLLRQITKIIDGPIEKTKPDLKLSQALSDIAHDVMGKTRPAPKPTTLQEKIVEKYVKQSAKDGNPVSEKDINSLRKLSKSLTELQGTDKIKADMAMQKILNSYEKSSVNDKLNAVRYISMLLNDATQTINALSGPLMASYGSTIDVLGTMVDVAMSATLKTPRSTTLYGTNPIRFLANWFKFGKVGAKAGYEGVNPAGIQGTNEIRGLAFKSKLNPLGQAERVLGAVAKGADYATYRTVYESELNKQGFLDALSKGIKRSDKAAIKQHVRKFVNDPPVEAIEQADRIGKNTTFQRSDSLGGKTANWINASPKLVKPVVNAVVPFVRTPLNITSTAVTATPAGIIKGLFQLSSLSQASQREAIRTLSMGLGGVGMTSLGFYLSKVGIITGANDTGNKDANSINEQAGRAKFRFNTSAAKRYVSAMLNGEGADAAEAAAKYQKGDKQFDYNKLQPLAFPLAMGAGYQEKKGSVGSKLSAAGTQSYGSLFGMSSLKGVQEVFQPQYTGTQADKAIDPFNRVIESYLKSFSPSFLAQEARRLDPVQRKTAYNEGIKADVTDYFKSRIPGLSQTLPEKKDTLGNTKVYPTGIVGQHLNPYKSEVANYSPAAALIADLIERTGDLSLAPSPPPKNFTRDGIKIDIPLKRYEKLQVDMGQEITKRIIEIEGGTDAELIEQINEIYSDVRDEYMDEVKDEL